MRGGIGDHAFFVIRAASNPLSEFVSRIKAVEPGVTTDFRLILEDWLRNPWNQKSLFLSSPGLFDAWQSQPLEVDPTSSIGKALWRYMLRSYSRATPFGLYAGVGVGRLADQQVCELGPTPWREVCRPDSALLTTISQLLIQEQSVRKQLQYSLNNSLYAIGQEYRFSQVVAEPNGTKLILTSLGMSDELNRIVDQFSQAQTLSYSDLQSLFAPEEQQEVEAYLDQLISIQFLSTNLLLPVTGEHWSIRLANLTKAHAIQLPLLNNFEVIVNKLLEKQQTLDELLTLRGTLDKIHESRQPDLSNSVGSMVQTDLVFTPARLTLSRDVVHRIAQQFLRLLPILRYKSEDPLSDFGRRFRKRYQDEAVDLLTVLDPEYGIGFHKGADSDSPLLNQIPFTIETTTGLTESSELAKSLYERFILTGDMELSLTDEDLLPYLNDPITDPLPSGFYLFGELYQERLSKSVPSFTSKPTENKWLFSLYSGTTSSPAFLLGRFCQNDPQLTRFVRTMCTWEQEQYPGEVLAEVVHAPPVPERARNVVSRPMLRACEIPYVVPASTDVPQVIYLSDLRVRVTEAGDIHLLHKKTGRRIRPRLSTAHKITLGDDIYQFLGYVEQMETHRYGWRWGYLQDQPRLPRVTYRNIVLHTARWTIRKQAILHLKPVTIEQLRVVYQLPRYVQLIGGDYALFLDLEVAPCQAILMDELEKNKPIRLKEWLPAAYQPWLADQNQEYVSEVIIPMKGPADAPVAVSQRPDSLNSVPVSKYDRNVFPGGLWLYYKVYLNELAADQLIRFKLPDFIHQLLTTEWCQQFFFVRYSDPDFHLRVRFLSVPGQYTQLSEACNAFFSALTQDLLVHRFQIDTYQREIERYTPALMPDCEYLFSQDSLQVLDYLSGGGEGKSDIDRYAFAFGRVNELLDNLQFSLVDKVTFCQQNQHRYWKEEKSLKIVRKSLNDLYRSYGDILFTQIQQNQSCYTSGTEKLQTTFAKINSYYVDKSDSVSRDAFVSSLIHMHVNRLFSVQQRRHELLIYHFLVRYYESRLARFKKDESSASRNSTTP